MSVYIEKIKVRNFKSFKEEEIKFKIPSDDFIGLNIFVGENNAGKSTLIEAINFLFDGSKKELSIIKTKDSNESEKLFVEITFCGNLTNLIENFCQQNKKEIFKKYIFKDGEIEHLIAKRDEDDLKGIYLYNKELGTYKNESGIDAPFKKLFELETIAVDKNPDEEIKYTSSSTIKKLLSLITSDFEERKEYKDYQRIHDVTFNKSDSALRKEIKEIEDEVGKVLKHQFGDLNIKLNFDGFNKDSFFKNSKLKVRDSFSNEEIDFEEKGEGTQRAISLSLVQVYSEYLKKHPEKTDATKPFYLFIDEPELSLHPEAQKKLLKSIVEICKKDQIFISTHSPYFLTPMLFKNVYKFQNSLSDGSKVSYDKEDKLKDVRENRKFMFHHRDILFKNRVLFVEGAKDLEMYSNYFIKQNKEHHLSCIYMLGGKGDFGSEIKTFCEVFKIDLLCIKDLDHLIEIIKKQPSIPERISQESQKQWVKRVYDKIDFSNKDLKSAISNELKSCKVLVNPYVDVEDFINLDGSINNESFEFSNKLFDFLE